MTYIDLTEFVEFGFLFEANRRFFHPLGLALEMVKNEDGKCSFVGVQDYRDDPEGCFFSFSQVEPERLASMVEKAKRVQELWNSKAVVREQLFGAAVEPLEGMEC